MPDTQHIELEIDGKPVSVPAGSTIMQAAKKMGIAIPHFCYHDKLSIAANCRMCLVQADKIPKPIPACATPVMKGMKVQTRSAMAVSAQKGVMELILINHPLDCPICDQGGECSLQDMSMGYGDCESPYQEEKRVVVNKNLGPLISTDMTRCIHCTRCVRFGEEWGGFMELGMGSRGEHAEIMTFMQGTVDSEISGNAIDLCPVGALTSKPFRYSARGWELTSIESVSPHDSWGSKLRIQVRDEQVYRVLPKTADDINQEWLSDRDRYSYTALNNAKRLTTPIILENHKNGSKAPRWREISWAYAMARLVDLYQGIATNDTQILAHQSQTLEELSMLRRLADASGMKLATALRRADDSLPTGRWLGGKINQFDKTDRVILIASFVRSEQPLLAARLRQAIRKGAQVSRIHVSGETWQMPLTGDAIVAPNQLVVALATLVQLVAKKSKVDLADKVKTLIPSKALEKTLLEALNKIAESLISGQSRVWLGLGHYAENHPEASTLAILTQTLNDIISKERDCAWGYLLTGANSLSAQALAVDDGINMVQKTPSSIYWLYGLDGVHDVAKRPEVLAKLSQAKAVISFSPFMPYIGALDLLGTTTQIILPIAAFTEQDGTMINAEGRIQSQNAAVPPLGEARPGWKVIRHVTEQLATINSSNYAALQSIFEQDNSIAQVKNKALASLSLGTLSPCKNWLIDIENRVPANFTPLAKMTKAEKTLTRVAEINLYATDPLVRRAEPLQNTHSAKDSLSARAHINPKDCAKLGINININGLGKLAGKVHMVASNTNEGAALECEVIADVKQPIGTIYLPTGHAVPFADYVDLLVIDGADFSAPTTAKEVAIPS